MKISSYELLQEEEIEQGLFELEKLFKLSDEEIAIRCKISWAATVLLRESYVMANNPGEYDII